MTFLNNLINYTYVIIQVLLQLEVHFLNLIFRPSIFELPIFVEQKQYCK